MSASIQVYRIQRVYQPPELISVPEADDPYEAMAIYLEREIEAGAKVRPVRGDRMAFVVNSRAGLVSKVWIVAVGYDEGQETRPMPALVTEGDCGS